MGRAYNVRKESIQKTGAAKAKVYSMYAREIYQTAKTGGTNPDSNHALKRLMEKAKKEQVPSDIIKRAIDKVNSGADESYEVVVYELFGPSGSTLIVECLTDNTNRTISSVRTAVNKCHVKMGTMGSILYQYDNLCIVGFKGLTEEETLDLLIEAGLDVDDIETNNNMIIIYASPNSLHDIKRTIQTKIVDVEIEIDEITWIPKEKITLDGEEKEVFNKLLEMLEDVEDVQNIYTNVDSENC